LKLARNYISSSARFSRVTNGLLVLDVGGSLNDRDWQALNDDAYLQARRFDSTGVVVTLDRSDVDVCGDIALRQLDLLASLDRSAFVPGAFVVAQRDLGLFRDLAWKMATMGMVAAAFTNANDAANFAQRKGEVWAAELAFRRSQGVREPQG